MNVVQASWDMPAKIQLQSDFEFNFHDPVTVDARHHTGAALTPQPHLTASAAAVPPKQPPLLNQRSELKQQIEFLQQQWLRNGGHSAAVPMPVPSEVQHNQEVSLSSRLESLEAESSSSLGEWVSAVLEVAPYLNSQGIHKALKILDRAIENSQQAKALDKIISAAKEAKPTMASTSSLPYFQETAEQMQMNLQIYQHGLLSQLQELRYEHPTGPRSPPGLSTSEASHIDPVAASMAALAQTNARNFVGAPLLGLHPRRYAGATVGPHWRGSALPPTVAGDASLDAGPGATYPAAAGGRSVGLRSPPGSFRQPRRQQQQQQQQQLDNHTMQQLPQRQVQTLSTSLQLLSHESPDRLFIVRRINKLGFKATRTLKRHFATFGVVVRVLVAHSTVRQHGDPACQARRRPSSLGFVQMATAEAVAQVLAAGDEQDVDGIMIRVQRFERQHGDHLLAGELDDVHGDDEVFGKEAAALSPDAWVRQGSASSEASTTDVSQRSGFSSGSNASSNSARTRLDVQQIEYIEENDTYASGESAGGE